ncbi:MAG TPA: lamin tail domain-containing protein, partial [Verrucomicrobiae bacterium]|nr:lamin tail domain-containing protein [Verrucomicrobiae bacterium]
MASASGASAGVYDVVVSNVGGSITSAGATLSVLFQRPGQPSPEPLGPASRRTGVVISEVMYHPAERADGRNGEFIELYNSNPYFEDISGWHLSGELDFTFPANTILPANGFLLVAPSPSDVGFIYGATGVLGGSTNKLANAGGTLRLQKRSGGIVLELQYSDQPPWPAAPDGTGHSLVLARPSYGQAEVRAWATSARIGGSPGAADPIPAAPLDHVVINEILAHTDLPLVDYIELFNYSPFTVDLTGCYLSDDPGTNKYRIPIGTILAPRSFVSFTETQLGFALGANGETAYLVNPDQTRVLDAVRFGGQANGISSGRSPDGAPSWSLLATRTQGTTNGPELVSSVVINEIMYNPLSGDGNDEYVELHNRSGLPVDVGGWRLGEGISFTIPPGTTIPGGGFLVVAQNAARLRTNYPGLNGSIVLGDFNGNLANGGERVTLSIPDPVVSTNALGVVTTNTFPIVVDEVIYGDGGRWGRWADGGGSSLELTDPRTNHRLAPNWSDSNEASKAPWTVVEATGVLDFGFPAVATADQLQVMLMGPGEALLDNVEVLVSGANRIPNSSFETGATGWFFQGTHSKSALETSEGFESTRSLRIMASERGDHVANRLRAPLSPAIPANTTVTIRARVRWLKGHPEILFRLRGGWLEASGRLSVPGNLGTPGAPNSRASANVGP